MRKLACLLGSFFLMFAFVYALSYLESSQGLDNPQWEGGRSELEMADINNDGNIDILSIGDHGNPGINSGEHGVMVWFGNGQGVWNNYQTGEFGYGGIAIGDINNDGWMDIGYGMHHNYSSNDFGDSIMEVALGDGSGQNWTAWDDGISIGDPDYWGMFCTDFADIDNDGDLDLGGNAFGADDGSHIFLNHGDGTWHQCFGYLGGNSTMDFCFGDVNADGYADFCVGHEYGSVYIGNGNGGFSLVDGNLPPAGSMGRRGPALGDVDNDGDQDFSFVNGSGGVEIWCWQGSNTWSNFSGSLPISGPYETTQLCDMNIDGYMDVAAFGDSTVSVWLGDGAGTWALDTTFNTPYPGYLCAFRAGGDGDHNGYPDIVLAAEEGDTWNAINHLRFFKESSTADSLFIFPVFPRGGERFYIGSVHFIQWSCGVPGGSTAAVSLELSTSGGSGPWALIASGVPNNGRFQWLIPASCPASTNCYVRYTATTNTDTAVTVTPASFTILPLISVAEQDKGKVFKNSEVDIYPTMCRERVRIDIKTYGAGGHRLLVHDGSGRLVRDLFKVKGSGQFKIYWDKTDNNGQKVSPGTYFVTLEIGERRTTQKIIVIE